MPSMANTSDAGAPPIARDAGTEEMRSLDMPRMAIEPMSNAIPANSPERSEAAILVGRPHGGKPPIRATAMWISRGLGAEDELIVRRKSRNSKRLRSLLVVKAAAENQARPPDPGSRPTMRGLRPGKHTHETPTMGTLAPR